MLKSISDPIYGDIVIDDDEQWVVEIIQDQWFQRLLYIKQMGLCFKTFPSATHTRFNHCLGAYYLAKKFLSRKEIRQKISDVQFQTIKAAALLHDIGHGPHSHGFEWYLKDLGYTQFHHENYSKEIVSNEKSSIFHILKKYGINPNDVACIISGQSPISFPKWACYVISSQIDVDRLDYLLRDEYFALGSTNNIKSLLKIIDKIHINEQKGLFYFNTQDIRLVDDFLYTRFNMYKELYLSENVNNSYRKVINILKVVKQLYLTNHHFIDQFNLFNWYKNIFDNKLWTLDEYINLTDESFNMFLISLKKESSTLNQLIDLYENELDQDLIQNHFPKNVEFYQNKKPIYIKQTQTTSLKTYDEVSALYQIFKKS